MYARDNAADRRAAAAICSLSSLCICDCALHTPLDIVFECIIRRLRNSWLLSLLSLHTCLYSPPNIPIYTIYRLPLDKHGSKASQAGVTAETPASRKTARTVTETETAPEKEDAAIAANNRDCTKDSKPNPKAGQKEPTDPQSNGNKATSAKETQPALMVHETIRAHQRLPPPRNHQPHLHIPPRRLRLNQPQRTRHNHPLPLPLLQPILRLQRLGQRTRRAHDPLVRRRPLQR